jgi:hypothetical protein
VSLYVRGLRVVAIQYANASKESTAMRIELVLSLDPELSRRLDRAIGLLSTLVAMEKREMKTLSEVVADIAADAAANKSGWDSVKQQVKAQYDVFGQQIQDLKDKLAQTGDVDKAVADLTALHTQFQGEAADMAAGITATAAVANTEAASSTPADAPQVPPPSGNDAGTGTDMGNATT